MALNNQHSTTLSATDMNFNSDYDNDLTSGKSVDLVLLSITAIIGIVGVFANGVVMYNLCFRIRRTPFTIYILNLAIVDFIFLLIFSFSVVFLIFREDVEIGIYTISDLLAAFFMFMYATSQYFHTVICVEISTSILFPVWYQCFKSKLQSTTVCKTFWVFSGVEFVVDFISCILYNRCEVISIIQAVISYLILLPLMVLSNVALVTLICQRSRRQHPLRLYILIISTVLAFLVLSVPLSVILFLEEFDIDLMGLTIIPFVSPGINSSLNPFIYLLVGSLSQQKRKCSIIAPLRHTFSEETASSQP